MGTAVVNMKDSLTVERKRSTVSSFERRKVSFEVVAKGNFWNKDEVIAKASLNLAPLVTKVGSPLPTH